MKIVISIILLGSLIFLVKKFNAKKPAKEISNETTEAADTNNVTDNGSNNPTDNESKKVPAQLDTDKASLAALQNDAGYKDVLNRIGILQAQNKWGVKDEGGFYYSVDNAGIVFSGGNSTDEYNSMVTQQTDYNTKVAALTKSIADAEGTPATEPSKEVDKATGTVSSLELPLEIKLMISAIKSKFSLDNADEEANNSEDEDTDEENNNNNYNGGNYGGNDNGGGGGGSNNNNPYPFANTVLPSAILPTAATSVIPTGATLANILSLPITKGVLPFKGNILPFNITPTPTPVINSTPNTANTAVSSERQAQPTSRRHSGHYYHTHRTH
jgi:hypothetical protein